MQIGSVVWEEFYHIHTYIHTHIHTHGIALSIRVTLNNKPALQVLINIISRLLPFVKYDCGRRIENRSYRVVCHS